MSKKIIIESTKIASGQQDCSIEELKSIYISYNKPKTNVVKMYDNYYVSFEPAPKLQFKISETINKDQLDFIEDPFFIDATKNEEGIFRFIVKELTQGKSVWQRVSRIMETILPLILLNMEVFLFASDKAISNILTALLTAVSIFVAIFSLFTINIEHINRKKVQLFEKGKLAYYFSVDKNLIILGICAILSSLFALLLVEDTTKLFWSSWTNYKKWFILAFLNIAFFSTYLVLRSIIEFYIHRPAKFILGDMKKESMENFDRQYKK